MFWCKLGAVFLTNIYITQIFAVLFIFLKLYIWFPCYMEPVVMTHGALAWHVSCTLMELFIHSSLTLCFLGDMLVLWWEGGFGSLTPGTWFVNSHDISWLSWKPLFLMIYNITNDSMIDGSHLTDLILMHFSPFENICDWIMSTQTKRFYYFILQIPVRAMILCRKITYISFFFQEQWWHLVWS